MSTAPASTASAPSNAKPKVVDPCKILTGEFRVSFPHVFEARAAAEGQTPKFSVVLLFPKATDLSALKAACQAAVKAKWGDKPPKGLRSPFRDGDEKDLDGYAGMIYVQASAQDRPGLVDANVQPIGLDRKEEFYAGCYARATIRAFAYDKNGNKGVSFALQNVQKLKDGEPFGSKRKAEDDFEAVAGATASAGGAAADFDDGMF
jgi:hypothetical protein